MVVKGVLSSCEVIRIKLVRRFSISALSSSALTINDISRTETITRSKLGLVLKADAVLTRAGNISPDIFLA